MSLTDYLSKADIQRFTRRSDWQGGWLVLRNWLLIAAIFAFVATWTNPLTILLAWILLGGQQLGLAVLMHEAGHQTLFKTPALNAFVGQWFCALPVLGDRAAYASSHREHHRLAGSHEDPDLPNYQNYPVSAASFRRKIWRDISGQTGMRLLAGLFSGIGNRAMMREGEGAGVLHKGLFCNAILFAVLWLAGIPEFYLLWVGAYLTSYLFVARIRQLAEHGNVEALYEKDTRGNTRTTYANLFERLVFAPNSVNYHVEHHLLASVPAWQLKGLHERLLEVGFYKDHPRAIASGYWEVIKLAVPELNSATAPQT